ncbi:MAG: flippase-like domain-containing protein [Spirochaetales bacterium]|nr:flippase-like domain-containing protein [Spirochaetales bacterium]
MRREYRTYLIGGLSFLALVIITFHLVFKGFQGAGTLIIPQVFAPARLALLGGLIILLYLFDGLRLYFVFLTIGTTVPFGLMLKLVFINIFASGVTPLATGGGFAQIYFLSKNKVPLGIATAASTMRTLIASVMIFGAVPVILVLEKGLKTVIPLKHGFLFSLLLILFYGALLWLLIRKKENLKKLAVGFINLLHRFHLIREDKAESMKENTDREIDLFSENLSRFWTGKKFFLFLSLCTALVYLLILFLVPFVLLRFMGEPVHLITVLSIQVLITFLIYFTPTPGGSGVAEGGFALIFSHFLTAAYVPPLTFYWRFITSYLGMLIGLIVFYREVWRKDRAVR